MSIEDQIENLSGNVDRLNDSMKSLDKTNDELAAAVRTIEEHLGTLCESLADISGVLQDLNSNLEARANPGLIRGG